MGQSTDKMDYRDRPQGPKEVLIEKAGAVIALKVDALNGTPAFVVQEVSTVVATSADAAKDWAEKQIGEGAQVVFVLGNDGWFLKAADSDFHFSEAQIDSFFSQELLQDLWLSHHPVASARNRYFDALKEKGIH